MTVQELLARISSRELTEWMEYYQMEPFGQERADLQAGVVASVVANVNRNSKSSKTWNPSDFMLQFEPPTPKSPQEIYRKIRDWAMMYKNMDGEPRTQ